MIAALALLGYNFWLLLGLLAIAVIIGIIATIAGVGGGVMSMPIFLLLLHFEPSLAKGTSLFTIFLSSGVAMYTHFKNHKIHLPSSMIMAGFAILGSLVCTFFQQAVQINEVIFFFIFGAFEILIGIRLGLKGIKSYRDEGPHLKISPIQGENDNLGGQSLQDDNSQSNLGGQTEQRPPVPPLNLLQNPRLLGKAAPLFFLAGFIATFFGIGGGVINTPTLYGLFSLPIHFATAGSTSIIFFTAGFNTLAYGLQGQIEWVVAITMALGMMAGGRIGAKTASKIPRWLTLAIIAVLLIFVGTRMIIGEI